MLIRIDDYQVLHHLASCIEAFEKAVDEPLTGQLIHIGKYTITVQPRNERAHEAALEGNRLSVASAELLGALRNALPPNFPWIETAITAPISEHVADHVKAIRGTRLITR